MTRDEAEKVRSEALRCGHKINAYVLSVAMHAAIEERLSSARGAPGQEFDQLVDQTIRSSNPKTALLIRCSENEAARIREAAATRKMTIVGFLRYALRITWEADNNKRKKTAKENVVTAPAVAK